MSGRREINVRPVNRQRDHCRVCIVCNNHVAFVIEIPIGASDINTTVNTIALCRNCVIDLFCNARMVVT